MTVILKDTKSNKIIIFTKGADIEILKRLIKYEDSYI
jgi:hypothetical protein